MSEWAILVGHEVRPVSMLEAARWREGVDFEAVMRVGLTDLLPGVRISTVFLLLNHGWNDVDLWFETLVYGSSLDQEMDRYTTWSEAETGHAVMVERVQQAIAQAMEESCPS